MKHTNNYMVRIYNKYGKHVDTYYFDNIVQTIDCAIENTEYSNVLHANVIPTMWIYSDTENDYIRICDYNYKIITKERCIRYIARMWVHSSDKNSIAEKNALNEIERTNFIYINNPS